MRKLLSQGETNAGMERQFQRRIRMVEMRLVIFKATTNDQLTAKWHTELRMKIQWPVQSACWLVAYLSFYDNFSSKELMYVKRYREGYQNLGSSRTVMLCRRGEMLSASQYLGYLGQCLAEYRLQ